MLTSWEAVKTIINGLKLDTSAQISDALLDNTYEPMDDDIPVVHLTGEIPTTKTEVFGQLEYISKTHRFKAYTRIKCQGTSSMAHPKKNFTVELYSDEGCSILLTQSFRHWGKHNNYVLKANYIDHLHARNIVCANLWADIVRSRPDFDSLPEELKNSPNMGAVDGFPVKVYANSVYQGLYTWNIPKCDWQFGLDESNPNHALLSAEFNDNGIEENQYNPCNFNALWDGNKKYWSIEVGSDSETIQNSLNSVIQEVIEHDTAAFENCLDVQSAIDYYIFQSVIGGIDGLAKNMLMVTYDMQKWYLGAYDCDATFDLHFEGFMMNAPLIDMPIDYQAQYSLLLEVIDELYTDAMTSRYWQLHNSALSVSNIMSKFEQFLSVADEDIRIEDTIAYPNIPSVTGNNLYALREWLVQRLAYLDNVFAVNN